MKILFLARRFYPEIGGVEKHCLEVAKILIEKGYEVSVVTEFPPKNQHSKSIGYQSIGRSDSADGKTRQPVKSIQNDFFELDKIKIIRLNFGKDDWFKKFRIWLKMLKVLPVVLDSDIIQCHDVFFWYLPFRVLLFWKKVYTTFHGYESFPVKKKAIIVRKLSEFLSYGSICIGSFMKKWYYAKPDFVSYGGVGKVKSSNLKVQSFKKNKKSAFFFGRLDEQTGILEYCGAVGEIRKTFPKFDFVVAGDGKFKQKVQKYSNVLGFVKNPEKLLVSYRFAFVSRYLSILEALASKRMVFALYDNPLKEDYLRMSPFAKYISISGSSEALVRDLLYYIEHPEAERQKIEAGYGWVQAQTWNKVVSMYVHLWKK